MNGRQQNPSQQEFVCAFVDLASGMCNLGRPSGRGAIERCHRPRTLIASPLPVLASSYCTRYLSSKHANLKHVVLRAVTRLQAGVKQARNGDIVHSKGARTSIQAMLLSPYPRFHRCASTTTVGCSRGRRRTLDRRRE